MITASGLSWTGSGLTVLEYADSDDGERVIGMTMGALGIAAWPLLSLILMRLASGVSDRGGRLAVRSVLGVGTALVLGLFIVALAFTRPPIS